LDDVEPVTKAPVVTTPAPTATKANTSGSDATQASKLICMHCKAPRASNGRDASACAKCNKFYHNICLIGYDSRNSKDGVYYCPACHPVSKPSGKEPSSTAPEFIRNTYDSATTTHSAVQPSSDKTEYSDAARAALNRKNIDAAQSNKRKANTEAATPDVSHAQQKPKTTPVAAPTLTPTSDLSTSTTTKSPRPSTNNDTPAYHTVPKPPPIDEETVRGIKNDIAKDVENARKMNMDTIVELFCKATDDISLNVDKATVVEKFNEHIETSKKRKSELESKITEDEKKLAELDTIVQENKRIKADIEKAKSDMESSLSLSTQYQMQMEEARRAFDEMNAKYTELNNKCIAMESQSVAMNEKAALLDSLSQTYGNVPAALERGSQYEKLGTLDVFEEAMNCLNIKEKIIEGANSIAIATMSMVQVPLFMSNVVNSMMISIVNGNSKDERSMEGRLSHLDRDPRVLNVIKQLEHVGKTLEDIKTHQPTELLPTPIIVSDLTGATSEIAEMEKTLFSSNMSKSTSDDSMEYHQ
jgi:ribosomal protein L40E